MTPCGLASRALSFAAMPAWPRRCPTSPPPSGSNSKRAAGEPRAGQVQGAVGYATRKAHPPPLSRGIVDSRTSSESASGPASPSAGIVGVFTALLLAVALVPVFSFDLLPLGDMPNHLARA